MRLEQLHNEFNELMKTIDYLNQILNDPELCKKVMKDELNVVKKEIPQKLSVVFQKLGAVTYPIYLFQMPVIEWLVIIGILHA